VDAGFPKRSCATKRQSVTAIQNKAITLQTIGHDHIENFPPQLRMGAMRNCALA
jgi:hypothetical protein